MSTKSVAPTKRSFNKSICVDGVEYPIGVTVSLIKDRGNLKGVVGLSYFGFLLNDIRIKEDWQGNTLVVFPSREFTVKATQKVRSANVYIPTNKFKAPVNQVIVACYQELLADVGPMTEILEDDSVAETKAA